MSVSRKKTNPFTELSGCFQAVHGNNLSRLDEVIMFAKKMGYKKIGMAFCIGLVDEAAILEKILSQHFEVYSTCCKIGGLKKEDYEIPKVKEDKIEVICDPVLQAKVLNNDKTELNLAVVYVLAMICYSISTPMHQSPLTL